MSPGPAAYSPVINVPIYFYNLDLFLIKIADMIKEKVKRSPLGSFGATEDRFKVSQLLQVSEPSE